MARRGAIPKTPVVAAIAAVIGIVFVILLISGWLPGPTITVVDDSVSIVLTLLATLGSGLTARFTHGRQRSAWLSLTVGLAGWAFGEMLWTYYELHLHQSPFPSLADAAYLVFPIGAGLALLLFPTRHTYRSRSRLVLDGLIVTASLFVVSWVAVLKTVYAAGAENRLAFILSLTYPASDLLVLSLAVLVLAGTRTSQRPTVAMIATGLACIALSDSVFAYLSAHGSYATGSLIDIGWVVGLLLILMAAVTERDAPQDDSTFAQIPSRVSTCLPYAPILFATVAIAVDPPRDFMSSPVFPVGGMAIVALLFRQYLVVNENRRLLATVAEQAVLDRLTGVANWALFHDRLQRAMQSRERKGFPLAVLSLDLNDFKLVNDSLGHPAGDTLLQRVAERIVSCVGKEDTVARMGGDEFMVLMQGNADHLHLVSHRIVEAFDEPFVIDRHRLLMRPSLGLAVADSPDFSAEELVKQADMAMYSAKRSRIGGVHAFTSELQFFGPLGADLALRPSDSAVVTSGAAMVRLLGELRQAIDHRKLDVVYQPKFDLRTGDIVGAEALLRWPHPERGVLAPKEFLPLVRRHGLMGAVTDLVLDTALDDARDWRCAGLDMPIAVNLFAPWMADLGLPERITSALAHRGLAPTLLTLEITEDLFLGNVGRTQTVLRQLREAGIRIAIDDFGTGYSALSYLRDLPIDEVKLDRQFIEPITADARAAALVGAVVDLAQVLGLTTVAEGVEDAETAACLRAYGCDVAQGYYYSRPVACAELVGMLKPAVAARP